jgi:hypothetical protein
MPGPDIFDQFVPAKWRDIEFPTTRMRMSVAHDLVEHKYYGVDGARVESVGLAPVRYTFSAPLLNGISPGKNERWASLYPNQMRKLLAAFVKKEIGQLQHPEFGLIECKAERFELDWDAARRGGVDAELSFVETLDDSAARRRAAGVQEQVNTPAKSLDSGKADLEKLLKAKGIPLPEYLRKPKLSLGEFVDKVQAVADAPALLQYRAAGRINSIVYHAKRLQQSVEKARSATTWPVTREVEQVRAGAFGLQERLLAATNKSIALFTVPAATTLAGVARQLPGAKVGDLIKLNPGLMRGPEIDAGTTVRYYAA